MGQVVVPLSKGTLTIDPHVLQSLLEPSNGTPSFGKPPGGDGVCKLDKGSLRSE